MKKLLLSAVLVSAAFLGGRFCDEWPIARGGGSTPLLDNRFCADVNGDGEVDISDSVRLLNFLFSGGEAPYCVAQGINLEEQLAALAARVDELEIPGCTNPAAMNYVPCANVDDGSCQFAAPVAEGFTRIGTNAQGYDEYSHDQTGIKFVLLLGGQFEMGSPPGEANRGGDEGPVHVVTLSRFLIAKHEVTQAEYAAVMADHATLTATPSFNPGSAPPDDRRPVEGASWDDINASDGFLERTTLVLPTESQWEYAVRGGMQTAFSFGDDCNSRNCDACATADEFKWWCGNSDTGNGRATHPVGAKLPNSLGLYDMHGNVFEWCKDVYDPSFYEKPEALLANPVSTSGSENRVIRGGGFSDFASSCRSANRFELRPSNRSHDLLVGFRPVRTLP